MLMCVTRVGRCLVVSFELVMAAAKVDFSAPGRPHTNNNNTRTPTTSPADEPTEGGGREDIQGEVTSPWRYANASPCSFGTVAICACSFG